MKTHIKILITILMVFCSCQRAKRKGNELIEKSKTEIADVSKKVWDKSVNYAYNSFSSTEKVKFIDIYSDGNIPKMKEMKGLQINFPSNFYSCYFKYKSDKTEMLEFLSNLKTSHSDISDTTTKKTNGFKMKKNLEFIERTIPKLKNKISFFYEIKNIENIEFYRCNKYPNANYLAIDIDNGIIYHLIEKYWD